MEMVRMRSRVFLQHQGLLPRSQMPLREAEHHGTERPNDGLMQGVNVWAASTSRGWLNELRTGSREAEKGFYKPMCVCVYVLRLGTKLGLNSTAPFMWCWCHKIGCLPLLWVVSSSAGGGDGGACVYVCMRGKAREYCVVCVYGMEISTLHWEIGASWYHQEVLSTHQLSEAQFPHL